MSSKLIDLQRKLSVCRSMMCQLRDQTDRREKWRLEAEQIAKKLAIQKKLPENQVALEHQRRLNVARAMMSRNRDCTKVRQRWKREVRPS